MKLYVIVEGGIIQDIVSDDPNAFSQVELTVIDYDTDGADQEDLTDIIQSDGRAVPALVQDQSIGELRIRIDRD